ncbi:MAG: hypothetical protein H6742_09500 [Alphaproteobacteria bacterium]|nr:hypothetical protein [Alphaproteobacteria bacterium]
MLLALLLACTSSPPPASTGVDTGAVDDGCGPAPFGVVEGTLFVDQAADPGGDGSRDAPFQTVAEAVDAASGDDVVAIAEGTYAGWLQLADRDLTLAGRCAERVTVDGFTAWEADTGLPAVIAFNQGSEGRGTGTLRLSGMTLTEGKGGGIVVEGGRLEARDLVVRGFREAGIRVATAEASLTDLRIEEARSEGATTPGLQVLDGSVEAAGLRVEGAIGGAVDVTGASGRLLLEDAELVDTQLDEFYRGTGLFLYSASAEVRRLFVSGAVNAGLAASQEATLVFEDVEVEGVRPPFETSGTCCPAVYAGFTMGFVGADDLPATISGTGLTVRDSASAVGASEGGAIYLTDVDARDLGLDVGGGGLSVNTGGHIEIDGLTMERSKGAAIFANVGGSIRVTDGEIVDVQRGNLQYFGGVDLDLYGVGALVEGGELQLQDVAFRGLSGEGIHVADRVEEDARTSSRVWLQDVTIEEIASSPSGRSAAGIVVLGGEVEADGLVVRDAAGPGLVVSPWDAASASATCTGCRFEEVEMAGAAVIGGEHGGTLALEDCVILGVAADPSANLSVGLMAAGASAPATLLAEGCTVDEVGVAAVVAQGEVAVTVRDSDLGGGSGATIAGGLDVHGNVVYATHTTPWDGSRGLRVEASTLSPGAGDAVLLHDASMTLSGTTWDGGTLRQQHCVDSAAVDGLAEAPEAVICPDRDVLIMDLSDSPFQFPPIVVF